MSDADFATALKRASYAAGMMLDVETIRAEQDYHRRRLDRFRHWFAGAGTIVGLAVTLRAEEPPNATDDAPVDVVVGPGIGLDGLGRDIVLSEPYCLDLLEWFRAEGNEAAAIRDGLDEANRRLRLVVTAQHEGVPSGLRPVLARKVNAGTDPVDTAAIRDATLLSLRPGAAPGDPAAFWPFPGLPRPTGDPLDEVTAVERTRIDGLAGAERARAELAARLVYGLRDDATALATDRPEEAVAPIVLAEVSVDLRDTDRPFVHPDHVTVDNLVRPMVPTPGQLAWLARQGA
jgi:hypothetical protein